MYFLVKDCGLLDMPLGGTQRNLAPLTDLEFGLALQANLWPDFLKEAIQNVYASMTNPEVYEVLETKKSLE